MDKLFITFEVKIADHEWSYQAARTGSAEVTIQVPRTILENIDPGNLFIGALQAALADFDTDKGESDSEG